MKIKETVLEYLLIFLAIIGIYTIGHALLNQLNAIWFTIGGAAFFLLIYLLLSSKSINCLVVLISTYLLIVFLPTTHYFLYSYNSKNYTYTKEFIDYKKSSTIQDLSNYNQLDNIINWFSKQPDSIKKIKSHTLFNNGILVSKDYIIGISVTYTGTFSKYPRYNIVFYNTSGTPLLKLKSHLSTSETLSDIINYYSLGYEKQLNVIKSPDKNVMLSDFWIEASTGFAFGDIKPISNTAKLIRILQFICAIFFGGFIAKCKLPTQQYA